MEAAISSANSLPLHVMSLSVHKLHESKVKEPIADSLGWFSQYNETEESPEANIDPQFK